MEEFEAEDVNRDGQVSPSDSLMIINRIRRRGTERGDDVHLDTNGDGDITPVDRALRIINRMRRQRDLPSEPQPPESPTTPQGDEQSDIQSFDGTGNNLENPEWGSAHSDFAALGGCRLRRRS